jgi:IS30 family transposase
MHPAEAIAKLIESGLTEGAIGKLVGVNQSTINRIRRGQVPTWTVGKALIDAASGQKKTRTHKRKAA